MVWNAILVCGNQTQLPHVYRRFLSLALRWLLCKSGQTRPWRYQSTYPTAKAYTGESAHRRSQAMRPANRSHHPASCRAGPTTQRNRTTSYPRYTTSGFRMADYGQRQRRQAPCIAVYTQSRRGDPYVRRRKQHRQRISIPWIIWWAPIPTVDLTAGKQGAHRSMDTAYATPQVRHDRIQQGRERPIGRQASFGPRRCSHNSEIHRM